MQAFERELAVQASGKTPERDRRPGSTHRQPYSGSHDRHHGRSHQHRYKGGQKVSSQASHQHHRQGGKCSTGHHSA